MTALPYRVYATTDHLDGIVASFAELSDAQDYCLSKSKGEPATTYFIEVDGKPHSVVDDGVVERVLA